MILKNDTDKYLKLSNLAVIKRDETCITNDVGKINVGDKEKHPLQLFQSLEKLHIFL